MHNPLMLIVLWALFGIAAWMVFDALTTGSVWVKGNGFDGRGYYKIERASEPGKYWIATVSTGAAAIAALLAPFFMN